MTLVINYSVGQIRGPLPPRGLRRRPLPPRGGLPPGQRLRHQRLLAHPDQQRARRRRDPDGAPERDPEIQLADLLVGLHR